MGMNGEGKKKSRGACSQRRSTEGNQDTNRERARKKSQTGSHETFFFSPPPSIASKPFTSTDSIHGINSPHLSVLLRGSLVNLGVVAQLNRRRMDCNWKTCIAQAVGNRGSRALFVRVSPILSLAVDF